jgi:outer membrane biosynthesis protein TonB
LKWAAIAALAFSTACATTTSPQRLDSAPDAPEAAAASFADAVPYKAATNKPKLLVRKEPRVPYELHGVTTSVDLELLVSTTGQVAAVRFASGDGRFFEAARTAARGWRFEPFLADDKPVAAVVPVSFSLRWTIGSPSPIIAHVGIVMK